MLATSYSHSHESARLTTRLSPRSNSKNRPVVEDELHESEEDEATDDTEQGRDVTTDDRDVTTDDTDGTDDVGS